MGGKEEVTTSTVSEALRLRREFIRHLEQTSARHFIVDVFGDFCGIVSCALERLCNDEKSREERYKSLIEKYTPAEVEHFHQMLVIVIAALESRRESFLGPVLEEIGAANKMNGQFLTPTNVAAMMSRLCVGDVATSHRTGELVKLNDPACGAGVTMISGAEAMRLAGVPQRDIMIYAGDIDGRACDITFVELTLLGYAARIDHMDALSMKRFGRPRWTVPYFLYGTRWREGAAESGGEVTA